MGLLIPVVYFCIAFAALWQSYRDPQVTLASLSQNATALAFFAIFVGLGFLLADQMLDARYNRADVYFITGFCFCWAALSALWLVRKVPQEARMNEPPSWLLQPFDYIDRCLLKIAGLCVLVVLF